MQKLLHDIGEITGEINTDVDDEKLAKITIFVSQMRATDALYGVVRLILNDQQ